MLQNSAEQLRDSDWFQSAKQKHDEIVSKIKEKYKNSFSSQEYHKIEKANWQFGKECIDNLFQKKNPNSEVAKQLVSAFDNIKHGVKTSQKDVKEAATLMAQVIENLPHKPKHPVFTVEEIVGRSFYNIKDNEIHLGTREPNYDPNFEIFPTAFHEMAHWLEETPEIKSKIVALYDKITEGLPLPISKKNVSPGAYVELYRKSKMKLPLEYCTRDYVEEKRRDLISKGKLTQEEINAEIEKFRKTRPTELLSVFFEQLLKNPASMLDEYQDYFEAIMEVLR
jgi:hypothetical protein